MHKLGIVAIQFWLEKYPQELPARIDKKNFILEGIKFILENNYFCFNDKYFFTERRHSNENQRGTCLKGKIWPLLEPKTESCFSPISPKGLLKNGPSVKLWHLFYFFRQYGNKNGQQNRLK